jgi:c-di-GMP-binding flagellar brake protein YcgR
VNGEKRSYPRIKVQAPIEIFPEPSEAPIRGDTTDLSLGGCYVGNMFPLAVDTPVEVRLRAGDLTIIALGVIKTCDPQVGNGIQFLRMLPEDRHDLKVFIETVNEGTPELPSPEPNATEQMLSN